MAASFNRVVLVGNLTRDPELKYIPSGTAVADITLAINNRVKKGDQWVEETTFVDITLWERTAEIASEYLTKGSSVLIEGRLRLETWETDGQKRSKLKVVGEKMQMLGSKGGGGGAEGGGGGGGASRGRPASSRPAGGGRSNQHDGPPPDADYGDAPASSGPADEDIPF